MADETLTIALEAQRRANDAIAQLPVDLNRIHDTAETASSALQHMGGSGGAEGLNATATAADHVRQNIDHIPPAAERAASSVGQITNKTREAASVSDGLAGAIGRIGSLAAGFVVAGGIQQLPNQLLSMAKAAAEDEAATIRLEQTVRNLGGSFDQQIAKVNERIEVGQRLAFSDDEIRDSFSKLAVATGSSEEALTRQTAAMDLARGAHIDLGTASKLLSKLNEENIEVFKRMGIVIGDNATEADALAAVQAKFGGQAQAFADSTAGQFERSKIAIAEVKEAIGYLLLPVLTQAAELGVRAAEGVQRFLGILNSAGVGAAAFNTIAASFERLASNQYIVIGLAAALGTLLVPAAVAAVAAAVSMTAAWVAAGIAMVAANAPIILIAAGVAGLVVGIKLLIDNWDTIVAKVPLLGAAFETVRSVVTTVFEWILNGLKLVLEGIEKIPYVGDRVRDAVDSIKGSLAGMKDVAGDAASGIGKLPAAALEAGTGGKAGLSPLQKIIQDIATDAGKAVSEIKRIGSEPNQIVLGVTSQISNAEGAIKGFTLAMSLAGPERDYWIARSAEMAAKTGIEGKAQQDLNKVVADSQAGRITAATATERYKKILDDLIGQKQLIIDAETGKAKAATDFEVASTSAARGVAKSSDDQVHSVQEAGRISRGEWTESERAAIVAAEHTNTAVSSIAGSPEQSAVRTNIGAIAALVDGPDVKAAAAAATQKSNDQIKLIGSDLSLPGIAQTAAKIPPPLLAAASEAKENVNGIIASIGQGIDLSAVTAVTGASLAAGIEAGFFGRLPSVRLNINAATNSLAVKDIPASAGTSSPSIYTIAVGRWLAEGIGVGFDQAIAPVQYRVRVSTQQVVGALTELTDGGFTPSAGALAQYNGTAGTTVQTFSNLQDGIRAAHYAIRVYNEETAAATTRTVGLQGGIQLAHAAMRDYYASLSQVSGLLLGTADPFREQELAMLRLKVRIAELNEELKRAEPYSIHAANIQADITTLQAWHDQIQAGIDVEKARQDLMARSVTAAQAFQEGTERIGQQRANVSQFGQTGADLVAAAQKAAAQNDKASADAAIDAFVKWQDDLKARAVPGWQAISEQGRQAIARMFDPSLSAAERAQALADLQGLMADQQAAAAAAATLTGQTYDDALNRALYSDQLATQLGQKGKALWDALHVAAEKGGEANIIAAANAVQGMIKELDKLPANIAGPLRERLLAAAKAYASAPNDPAVQAELLAAVTASEQALEVIPQTFERMPPRVQAAVIQLWQLVKDGTLTGAQAATRETEILRVATQYLGSEFDEVRNKALDYIHSLESGGEVVREFDDNQRQLTQHLTEQQKAVEAAAAETRKLAIAQRDANDAAAGYHPPTPYDLQGPGSQTGGTTQNRGSGEGGRQNIANDPINDLRTYSGAPFGGPGATVDSVRGGNFAPAASENGTLAYLRKLLEDLKDDESKRQIAELIASLTNAIQGGASGTIRMTLTTEGGETLTGFVDREIIKQLTGLRGQQP